MRLRCRRYQPSDRDACQRLFDSNTPASFVPHEREEFLSFVDRRVGTYLVIEDDTGAVVACGGVASRGSEAALCWGMADSRLHQRGIGRFLLRVRLAAAVKLSGITEVAMNTSHQTAGFFAREGFETLRVTLDFFRPGLHKHDMRLLLDDAVREAVSRRLDEELAAGHRVDADVFG